MPELDTEDREKLRKDQFAYVDKEGGEHLPIHDEAHVRNAIARFDQVEGVSDSEREAAWRRIRAAAKKYGVEVTARGWRSLMKGGRSGRQSGQKTRRK